MITHKVGIFLLVVAQATLGTQALVVITTLDFIVMEYPQLVLRL